MDELLINYWWQSKSGKHGARELKKNYYLSLQMTALISLLLVVADFAVTIAIVNPKATKASNFAFHAEGKKLIAPNSESITVEHQNQCAMICSNSTTCRSFNYCGRTLRELQIEDVYSTEMGEAILHEDSNCIHVSMEHDDAPVCQEDGQEVDILSNVMFKFCRIKDKRVDQEWGEWQSVVLDTKEDYKEYEIRFVTIEAAHGGTVGSKQNERVNYWLKFVHERKVFDDARDGCEQMNGTLFSDVDGTEAQLKGFLEKLHSKHWLGIYTTDHIVWRNLEDDPIPNAKLRWNTAEREPNNEGNEQFWVMVGTNASLHDTRNIRNLKSICRLK